MSGLPRGRGHRAPVSRRRSGGRRPRGCCAELDEHGPADPRHHLDRAEPGKREQATGIDSVTPGIARRQSLESGPRHGRGDRRAIPAAQRQEPLLACVRKAVAECSTSNAGSPKRRWLRENRESVVGHRHQCNGRGDTRIGHGGHQRQSATQRHAPNATRSGSTPSSPRAYSTAACQSSS